MILSAIVVVVVVVVIVVVVAVLCSIRHREPARPVTASSPPGELSDPVSSFFCSSSPLYRQLCPLPQITLSPLAAANS